MTSVIIFHCDLASWDKLQIHTSCWTFNFHVGVHTYAIKQEIVYTQGQLKLTHMNFAILNSHVTVMYLRFIKNTIFMWYHRKIEHSCIGFFQAGKLLQ